MFFPTLHSDLGLIPRRTDQRLGFRPLSGLTEFLAWAIVLFLLLARSVSGEPLQVKHHNIPCRLDPREKCRTWEVRFDLDEKELMEGKAFTRRRVATSNSLEMVFFVRGTCGGSRGLPSAAGERFGRSRP